MPLMTILNHLTMFLFANSFCMKDWQNWLLSTAYTCAGNCKVGNR